MSSEDPAGPALAGRVASGVRWAAADQLLQQVARIAITVLLTRLTRPSDYGLIGIAFVVTQVSSFVTDLGMGPALVQRRDLEPRHVSTALTSTLVFSLVLAGIVVGTAGPISSFFDQPDLVPVLMVMSVNFPLKGLSAIPRDLLRRQLLFRPFVISSGVAVIGSGLLGVAIAAGGGGVWALVAYSVAESALTLVVGVWLAMRAGVFRPRLGFARQAFNDLFRFGASVSAFKLVYYAQINADNLLVGKVLGASALGFYGLAYRVMLYPIQKVADVISQVAMPAFASVQDDKARLSSSFERGVQAISLVCFPLSIGILVAAPLLIPVAFGQRWAPAVTTVQILCLNGPRMAINRLNGAVFQGIGKPQWDLWLASGSLVVYLAAFAIGVRHGITGMAIAYTVAGFAIAPVSQVMATRAVGTTVRRNLWAIRQIAGATAAMALASEVVRRALGDGAGRTISLAVVVMVGALTYAIVIALTARPLAERTWRDLARRDR